MLEEDFNYPPEICKTALSQNDSSSFLNVARMKLGPAESHIICILRCLDT